MAQERGTRSVLATIVGYAIVALVGFFVLRFVVGAVFGLFRWIIVLVIIGALVTLYLRLKLPDDP